MKKNKFVISTLILTIGGLITKILNMIIKIVSTRVVGTEGIGLYMLINPTFLLFITLCTLGLPTAISKLISENKNNDRNVMFSSIFVILIIDILLMFFIFLSSNFISINLLNEPKLKYPLICISFVLPFISISSILRGYFFGKEKMFPHVLSNNIEDITRLISIILFTPLFLKKGIVYAVSFLILSNVISELTSIIILILFLPKNIKLNKTDIKLNNIKEVLNIGIPTTTSRLIGTIGYFFEPIILSFFLIKNGIDNNYIINEYGVINGYVMPIILLPSFFTNAISQALLPIISSNYVKKNYKYIRNKINQAIVLSLLIGIPSIIFLLISPDLPLKLLFNTNKGTNYIRLLAPVSLLYYIQSPLTISLHAIGKSKNAMIDTLIGTIIRIISLIIFNKLGIYSLIIATSLNILYVTINHIININKIL